MPDDKSAITNADVLRKKAEKLLAKRQKSVDNDLNVDVQRLLHELQVHQIELEMQNEELQNANIIAETALKKYTILYDFAPTGYFTLNDKGYITELNFTAAEMLGQRRIRLLNRNFRIFISDDTKPLFNSFFSKVFQSNEKEFCEVTLVDDDHTQCIVRIEGFVVAEDQNCLLSVLDITEYK
jgi:PAS domain S-box-containing protein